MANIHSYYFLRWFKASTFTLRLFDYNNKILEKSWQFEEKNASEQKAPGKVQVKLEDQENNREQGGKPTEKSTLSKFASVSRSASATGELEMLQVWQGDKSRKNLRRSLPSRLRHSHPELQTFTGKNLPNIGLSSLWLSLDDSKVNSQSLSTTPRGESYEENRPIAYHSQNLDLSAPSGDSTFARQTFDADKNRDLLPVLGFRGTRRKFLDKNIFTFLFSLLSFAESGTQLRDKKGTFRACATQAHEAMKFDFLGQVLLPIDVSVRFISLFILFGICCASFLTRGQFFVFSGSGDSARDRLFPILTQQALPSLFSFINLGPSKQEQKRMSISITKEGKNTRLDSETLDFFACGYGEAYADAPPQFLSKITEIELHSSFPQIERTKTQETGDEQNLSNHLSSSDLTGELYTLQPNSQVHNFGLKINSSFTNFVLISKIFDMVWKIACIYCIAHIIESTHRSGAQTILNPKDSTVNFRVLMPKRKVFPFYFPFWSATVQALKPTLAIRNLILYGIARRSQSKGKIGDEEKEYFALRSVESTRAAGEKKFLRPQVENHNTDPTFGNLSKSTQKFISQFILSPSLTSQSATNSNLEKFEEKSCRSEMSAFGQIFQSSKQQTDSSMQGGEPFGATAQASQGTGPTPKSENLQKENRVKPINYSGNHSFPSAFLFVGPPGSGKTKLAEKISFISKKPLLICSSSSIQKQIQIGTRIGAKRVEKLFKSVQNFSFKNGSCILFLDEIDSIGRSRNGTSTRIEKASLRSAETSHHSFQSFSLDRPVGDSVERKKTADTGLNLSIRTDGGQKFQRFSQFHSSIENTKWWSKNRMSQNSIEFSNIFLTTRDIRTSKNFTSQVEGEQLTRKTEQVQKVERRLSVNRYSSVKSYTQSKQILNDWHWFDRPEISQKFESPKLFGSRLRLRCYSEYFYRKNRNILVQDSSRVQRLVDSTQVLSFGVGRRLSRFGCRIAIADSFEINCGITQFDLLSNFQLLGRSVRYVSANSQNKVELNPKTIRNLKFNYSSSATRSQRNEIGSSGDIKLLTEFLIQMDNRLHPSKAGGFFIIGTTNSLYVLDSALIRSGRFDRIFNLNYPNSKLRKTQLLNLVRLARDNGPLSQEKVNNLKALLSHKKIKIGNLFESVNDQNSSIQIPWKFFVFQTENYSPADLTRLVDESVLWNLNILFCASLGLADKKALFEIKNMKGFFFLPGDTSNKVLEQARTIPLSDFTLVSLLNGLKYIQNHKNFFQT